MCSPPIAAALHEDPSHKIHTCTSSPQKPRGKILTTWSPDKLVSEVREIPMFLNNEVMKILTMRKT